MPSARSRAFTLARLCQWSGSSNGDGMTRIDCLDLEREIGEIGLKPSLSLPPRMFQAAFRANGQAQAIRQRINLSSSVSIPVETANPVCGRRIMMTPMTSPSRGYVQATRKYVVCRLQQPLRRRTGHYKFMKLAAKGASASADAVCVVSFWPRRGTQWSTSKATSRPSSFKRGALSVRQNTTIEEFAADGYTHIECYCPRCRVIGQRPISWLPRISLGLTIAQLSVRLRCADCGGPLALGQAVANGRRAGQAVGAQGMNLGRRNEWRYDP